jgi:hypothetical protein
MRVCAGVYRCFVLLLCTADSCILLCAACRYDCLQELLDNDTMAFDVRQVRLVELILHVIAHCAIVHGAWMRW